MREVGMRDVYREQAAELKMLYRVYRQRGDLISGKARTDVKTSLKEVSPRSVFQRTGAKMSLPFEGRGGRERGREGTFGDICRQTYRE